MVSSAPGFQLWRDAHRRSLTVMYSPHKITLVAAQQRECSLKLLPTIPFSYPGSSVTDWEEVLEYLCLLQTMRWVENWLDNKAQGVVMRGIKSSRQTLVSIRANTGQILLTIFNKNLRSRIEQTLSKLTDDNKSGEIGQYAGGQGCSAEGPCQAGEMGLQETQEVQRGKCKVLSLEGVTPCSRRDWGQLARSQLWQKTLLGSPARQQAEPELTMWPCSKKD